MGGFALSKIRRRSSSLLRRPRSGSTANAKSATRKCPSPVIEGGEATDDSSCSDNSHQTPTIVTYESSNDNSTLSSIHTSSMTSFAGNLSPPEIQFRHYNDEQETIMSYDRDRRIYPSTSSMCSIYRGNKLKKNRSAGDNYNKISNSDTVLVRHSSAPTTMGRGRKSPEMSSKPSRNPSKIHDSTKASMANADWPTKTVKESATPPSPSKKTIQTSIVNQDNAIDNIPQTIDPSSSLEDFHPTVEVGQEMNDEERTVMTMELLENMHSLNGETQKRQGGGGACHSMMFLGGYECIETFYIENDIEDHNDDDGDGTTISLFDDEGNEFVFERKQLPQQDEVSEKPSRSVYELVTDISAHSKLLTSSQGGGTNAQRSNQVSNKVGSEIIFKKKYQAGGSVVKHLNALYKQQAQLERNSSETSSKASKASKSSKSSKKKESAQATIGKLDIETFPQNSKNSATKTNQLDKGLPKPRSHTKSQEATER
eukprot:CAMPEP_0183716594 /NCGR_PEP_ID=MMETSP0737-20130205/10449_1 /TAXON_ID=385413 /ORGANISM="Thalassiosira miniscula, Strain CCMP1093" /LENGTH=483 /DNA_ID=CAMNT_0025945887 /DNA_START=167 /DNA_END=1618 /DNA_ORIENTATION=-